MDFQASATGRNAGTCSEPGGRPRRWEFWLQVGGLGIGRSLLHAEPLGPPRTLVVRAQQCPEGRLLPPWPPAAQSSVEAPVLPGCAWKPPCSQGAPRARERSSRRQLAGGRALPAPWTPGRTISGSHSPAGPRPFLFLPQAVVLRKWGAGAPRPAGPPFRRGPALLARAGLDHCCFPAGLPPPCPQGASCLSRAGQRLLSPTAPGARPPGNKAWGEGQGVWRAGDLISPRLPPCPARPPTRPRPRPAGFSAWLALGLRVCLIGPYWTRQPWAEAGRRGECPVQAQLLLRSPQAALS